MISAILAVEIKNLYRSILFLGLFGVILGVVFFTLNANLIGIFQIAVYGGISIVLILLITILGERHE